MFTTAGAGNGGNAIGISLSSSSINLISNNVSYLVAGNGNNGTGTWIGGSTPYGTKGGDGGKAVGISLSSSNNDLISNTVIDGQGGHNGYGDPGDGHRATAGR